MSSSGQLDGSLPQESAPTKESRQRVYQRWEGNEKFFLYGSFVAGPNWRASLGTFALIAAPAGVFLAFVAPYLTREVHAIIMVFSCLLPTLSMVFLFMTACRDPGIIPRQQPDEDFLNQRKPRTKEVYVNNHKVLIRYNDTCHFYQPPRAHHCSVNDNCIERFDHHCPWVGTTIGKRNYRTFLLFIYTTTVLCMYVFGCSLAQLFVRHQELADEAAAGQLSGNVWGRTLRDVIPALVLMGYTFLFFWFVGGLSMFHCYLVGTNQTTYENFRYNHDNRPNPYDRGLFLNCAEVWCMPTPSSQVNFRAYVDEVKPQLPAYNNPSYAAPQPAVQMSTQQQQQQALCGDHYTDGAGYQYPSGQPQYEAGAQSDTASGVMGSAHSVYTAHASSMNSQISGQQWQPAHEQAVSPSYQSSYHMQQGNGQPAQQQGGGEAMYKAA